MTLEEIPFHDITHQQQLMMIALFAGCSICGAALVGLRVFHDYRLGLSYREIVRSSTTWAGLIAVLCGLALLILSKLF